MWIGGRKSVWIGYDNGDNIFLAHKGWIVIIAYYCGISERMNFTRPELFTV